MAHVIAVAGKGGVGKSTLCAGIGAALAMRGARVLLVDGDAGLRSLDYMLGVTEGMVYDAGDVANGRIDPSGAVYASPDFAGLYMLPAPMGKPLAPTMMSAIVTVLASQFDRVLIDCPAGIGSGLFSAAAPAQEIFLVATVDPISVRSAAEIRRQMQESGNRNFRLLLNRFSAKCFWNLEDYRDLDEVIDAVGAQLLGIVPEDEQLQMRMKRNWSGKKKQRKLSAVAAFQRIGGRIAGEQIRLPDFE